jgi:peptidoglycan/LPS O-acetylase OafA/YrhL
MGSSVERLLQRYQDNRAAVAKWAAIISIVWALVALALVMYGSASGQASLVFFGVKFVMPPVLISGVAWGTARSVRGSRRDTLLPMGAMWLTLIVVFVVMIQYNSVVYTSKQNAPNKQTELIQMQRTYFG